MQRPLKVALTLLNPTYAGIDTTLLRFHFVFPKGPNMVYDNIYLFILSPTECEDAAARHDLSY